jgi:hypothetical protein
MSASSHGFGLSKNVLQTARPVRPALVPAEAFSMGFRAWALEPRPSEGPGLFRTQIGLSGP